MTLSETQTLIRDMAREFAQRAIAPVADEIDEEERWPAGNVAQMGELGLMGLEVPEAWGGTGADATSYALAMEEIAKVCASHSVIMSVQNSLFCHGLNRWATEEQKERFLVPVASGRALGCYSLTEPQSGSDAANLTTTAIPDGDHYLVSGHKSWVTCAPHADFILLFATTDRAKGYKGGVALVVETRETPGFSVGKAERKLGIRAAHTAELHFQEARVPRANRIGEEGQGFYLAMKILEAGRIGIAAQAVGIAQAAYEASVRYAGQRQAFGRKIGEFQGLAWTLADMHVRIQAARLLTLDAARAKDAGRDYGLQASMAKLYASEAAMWVTSKGVQVHGGMGYSRELPLQRYFRDAKITEIYEGTSEIQRHIISRRILGLE